MKKIVLLCSAGMSTSMLVKKCRLLPRLKTMLVRLLPIQWLRLATRPLMLM